MIGCQMDLTYHPAGLCGAVGSASVSRSRGHGFDTRSGHILSFFLPLIEEEQLSVTGESIGSRHILHDFPLKNPYHNPIYIGL